MKIKTIVLGADHAGFEVKEFVKQILGKLNYKIEDVGAYVKRKRDDYPDYAEKVALKVRRSRERRGILACGTGIGASIAANKIPGIRAALVCNTAEAKLSEEHNNANILVLGGRPFNRKAVRRIVKTWLKSKFAGGRHARRVNKITALEKKYGKQGRGGHIR